MGSVRSKEHRGLAEPAHPLPPAPPTNETLTRALGGYEENRRVPSLLELKRKGARLILVPYAVNIYGWQNYHTKIVEPE